MAPKLAVRAAAAASIANVAAPPSSSSAAPPSQPAVQSRSEPRIALVTSKEWVVPPRPKPGRKPAKFDDSSSKKSTQRAFRERRQEYIAELEEKVRALEAGEGDKAVFFQSQAVKAKEESTLLRIENERLRKQVAELHVKLGELASQATSPSSSTESASPISSSTSRLSTSASKRSNSTTSEATNDSGRRAKRPRRASNVSMASASTSATPIARSSPAAPHALTSSGSAQPIHADNVPQQRGMFEGSCGFCAADACLCAQVASYEPTAVTDSTPAVASDSPATAPEPSPSFTSISSTASAAVAVPLKLRRRTTGAAPAASVWKLESSQPVAKTTAVCSGDPSNCPACADDPFGKAFCESLSQSICSTQPCADCPSRQDLSPSKRIPTPPPSVEELDADETAALLDTFTDLPCCGEPTLCGSASCGTELMKNVKEKSSDVVEMLPRSVPSGVRTVEDIPCSEAWSVLKAHPNIAFTNLQMLADVVAKRTRCDGPGTTSASSSPALGPTRSADEIMQRRRLTVERGAVDQALELLNQGSLRR